MTFLPTALVFTLISNTAVPNLAARIHTVLSCGCSDSHKARETSSDGYAQYTVAACAPTCKQCNTSAIMLAQSLPLYIRGQSNQHASSVGFLTLCALSFIQGSDTHWRPATSATHDTSGHQYVATSSLLHGSRRTQHVY